MQLSWFNTCSFVFVLVNDNRSRKKKNDIFMDPRKGGYFLQGNNKSGVHARGRACQILPKEGVETEKVKNNLKIWGYTDRFSQYEVVNIPL